MPWLLLGALAFLAYVVLSQTAPGPPRADTGKRMTRLAAVVLSALAVLLLLREQVLAAALLAVCILVLTGAHKKLLAGFRGQASQRPEDGILEMHVDARSGTVDGIVRAGAFAGQRLSGLDLEQLKALYAGCVERDPASAQALKTYLERRFGSAWSNGGTAGSGARMSRAEALEILGLTEGASASAINDAYRHLMAKVHPDHGGTSYLAAQLNRARETLLG